MEKQITIMEDIGKLQKEWEKLIESNCMTKKAICDLCIPFRDKYKLNDKQTLMIARQKTDLQDICEWLNLDI